MKKEDTSKFGSCPCFDGQNEDKSLKNNGMMKCMKGAKWFLLVPGVLITIAFLLGYFLEAETVRMLWLIISGALLLLGTIFYILMNIWVASSQKKIGI